MATSSDARRLMDAIDLHQGIEPRDMHRENPAGVCGLLRMGTDLMP